MRRRAFLAAAPVLAAMPTLATEPEVTAEARALQIIGRLAIMTPEERLPFVAYCRSEGCDELADAVERWGKL